MGLLVDELGGIRLEARQGSFVLLFLGQANKDLRLKKGEIGDVIGI